VGNEGTLLCDMGSKNLTVSDISDVGVDIAMQRDPRLKGLTLNAEETGLKDGSYDVVIFQNGLHHLPSPVLGFTEMLRVSRRKSIFLEPHDSLVGNLIGTEWARNRQAINYVFRLNDWLVKQEKIFLVVANINIIYFPLWQHNMVFAKILSLMGPLIVKMAVCSIKYALDRISPRYGNNFCAIVVK
jgi:ubiquinone/menaquinone biosynthesis C-methylase UbiE